MKSPDTREPLVLTPRSAAPARRIQHALEKRRQRGESSQYVALGAPAVLYKLANLKA